MSDTIENVISELGAGHLRSQLAAALKEVGAKTAEHGKFGKEGKVIITLKFIPTKEGEQINIESKLYKEVPTSDGHMTRSHHHVTPFFVDNNMELNVICPEEKDGQINLVK